MAAEPTTARRSLPPGIKAIATTNLQNTFQVTTNLYSGSAPDDEADFAELARLGIKTILSVDGAKPRVELARKYGLRYVHIPHGYDGISPNTQAQLIKAAQLSPEPIFIHCHQGLHRGPTAAAVICMAKNGWPPALGEEWLKAAGTGSEYSGLYQTVRAFQKPSAEQLRALPSTFPEVAKVSSLVDAMVAIDERWDYFKALRKAGYQKPAEHPALDPAHEAVILWEQLREAQRLDTSEALGKDFLERLKLSEIYVQALEKAWRQQKTTGLESSRAALDRQFDLVAQSCVSCHKAYRDRKH